MGATTPCTSTLAHPVLPHKMPHAPGPGDVPEAGAGPTPEEPQPVGVVPAGVEATDPGAGPIAGDATTVAPAPTRALTSLLLTSSGYYRHIGALKCKTYTFSKEKNPYTSGLCF